MKKPHKGCNMVLPALEMGPCENHKDLGFKKSVFVHYDGTVFDTVEEVFEYHEKKYGVKK